MCRIRFSFLLWRIVTLIYGVKQGFKRCYLAISQSNLKNLNFAVLCPFIGLQHLESDVWSFVDNADYDTLLEYYRKLFLESSYAHSLMHWTFHLRSILHVLY